MGIEPIEIDESQICFLCGKPAYKTVIFDSQPRLGQKRIKAIFPLCKKHWEKDKYPK